VRNLANIVNANDFENPQINELIPLPTHEKIKRYLGSIISAKTPTNG
jgi:hypothetical protein